MNRLFKRVFLPAIIAFYAIAAEATDTMPQIKGLPEVPKKIIENTAKKTIPPIERNQSQYSTQIQYLDDQLNALTAFSIHPTGVVDANEYQVVAIGRDYNPHGLTPRLQTDMTGISRAQTLEYVINEVYGFSHAIDDEGRKQAMHYGMKTAENWFNEWLITNVNYHGPKVLLREEGFVWKFAENGVLTMGYEPETLFEDNPQIGVYKEKIVSDKPSREHALVVSDASAGGANKWTIHDGNKFEVYLDGVVVLSPLDLEQSLEQIDSSYTQSQASNLESGVQDKTLPLEQGTDTRSQGEMYNKGLATTEGNNDAQKSTSRSTTKRNRVYVGPRVESRGGTQGDGITTYNLGVGAEGIVELATDHLEGAVEANHTHRLPGNMQIHGETFGRAKGNNTQAYGTARLFYDANNRSWYLEVGAQHENTNGVVDPKSALFGKMTNSTRTTGRNVAIGNRVPVGEEAYIGAALGYEEATTRQSSNQGPKQAWDESRGTLGISYRDYHIMAEFLAKTGKIIDRSAASLESAVSEINGKVRFDLSKHFGISAGANYDHSSNPPAGNLGFTGGAYYHFTPKIRNSANHRKR